MFRKSIFSGNYVRFDMLTFSIIAFPLTTLLGTDLPIQIAYIDLL